MAILLTVKNLNVKLAGQKILKNLSFQVNQGEILTILGANGAGKTVLLKTLLGFLPYEGEIHWHQKLKIAYLPQGLNQLSLKDFPLTVKDFFFLKNQPPSTEEINKFLTLVGLKKEIFLKAANSLSSGQFQRMLVAWTLVSHPQVLFFDEPTTGIDIGGGETIYSLIQTIWRKENLTIFLVTHDLNIVYKNSTNVLCLQRKGHPCFGPPKSILSPKILTQIFDTEIKFYEHR